MPTPHARYQVLTSRSMKHDVLAPQGLGSSNAVSHNGLDRCLLLPMPQQPCQAAAS